MNIFALNLGLAFTWAALTANITLLGLVIGFVVGLGALYLSKPLFPGSEDYFRRGWLWGKMVFMFTYELVASSIQVAWCVLSPSQIAKPGILSMPLDVTGEMQILSLTNMITLTPGTLSLDVTEDCKTLYIHAMFADDPDAIRADIKNGMERWVIEAME